MKSIGHDIWKDASVQKKKETEVITCFTRLQDLSIGFHSRVVARRERWIHAQSFGHMYSFKKSTPAPTYVYVRGCQDADTSGKRSHMPSVCLSQVVLASHLIGRKQGVSAWEAKDALYFSRISCRHTSSRSVSFRSVPSRTLSMWHALLRDREVMRGVWVCTSSHAWLVRSREIAQIPVYEASADLGF